MAHDEEGIKYLLQRSEDELYAIIVDHLPEYQNDVFSPIAKTALGRKWFCDRLSALRKAVCIEWDAVRKMDDPALSDRVTLVAAISDAISEAALGLTVPVAVLSVLVVRIGVRNFCQGDAEQVDPGKPSD